MTFDLDDTFYDNWPIIMRAEQSLMQFIASSYPLAKHISSTHWLSFKAEALQQHPELKHDMGKLRLASLSLGLASAGYHGEELNRAVQACFEQFYTVRSDFTIDDSVHAVLESLAQRIPLVAITNGNVDCEAIGISQYFSHIYHANTEYRSKPHPDMFDAAVDILDLSAKHILHVGDNAYNDVWGAHKAGMATAWFAANRSMYLRKEPFRALPCVQLDNLNELLQLV